MIFNFNPNVDFPTSEFESMVLVARILAVLHIFYQIKKLKLLKSKWLFFTLGTIGLSLGLMLALFCRRQSQTRWSQILPITLLVTEFDFIHALVLISARYLKLYISELNATFELILP